MILVQSLDYVNGKEQPLEENNFLFETIMVGKDQACR